MHGLHYKEEMNDIETNKKLRERIVDLADLWDGPESMHYGNRLQAILDDLGIKDIPEFYKPENINKFVKELDEERRATSS